MAPTLVQVLEAEKVRVDWTPPEEKRDLGAIAAAVAIGIVASGSYDAIKAAVRKVRDRLGSAAEITIEDEGNEGGE